MQKVPVMETTVQKQPSSKWITSTLCDPRKVDDRAINWEKMNLLKERLTERNNKKPFVTCVQPKCDGNKINTSYGMFPIGSLLSFHLKPAGFTTNVITNFPELHELPKLPLSFISEEHNVVAKNWVLTEHERAFLATVKFTEQNSYVLEQETVKQSLCELWKNSRKNRITSSNAHRVFIRKRNFESLAESLLNPNLESNLPAATRDAFRHGRIYEPVAREKYLDVMKFHLNRNIDIRETGLVLQPKLFWLAASPDGLVSDKSNEDVRQIGLIEIKCPKSKKNSKINDLVHDQSFYVKYEDGVPVLKKDHPNGYYTQIQMAMGLSQITFCDFIVYTFDGMIIIRTQFDEDYFFSLMQKLNSFYKDFMLPKLVTNLKNCTT